jgi:zinc protease
MKRLACMAALCGALCLALNAQVKLPPYTREVLTNGTVVYFVQRTALPLVSFRVLVKGGPESEPVGMAGLSAVTAELLRRGARGSTATQFAEELDGLGGSFLVNEDEQSTAITAEYLKKDFDAGLKMVADAVLHPSFPPEEVRKTLARRGDQLKAGKDNPNMAIASYFGSFFFGGGHPYGRVADEASIDRIRRDDIIAYHDRMYVGRNLIVIVAGDFEQTTAKARVADTFGAAPAGVAYTWAPDQQPRVNGGPRVLLIDKPDATQTYFMIGQPGVRRSTPDRIPLTLVNLLFGGRFTSMLNEALRVHSGLTYGASCRVEMARLTGGISISTYTKTETTERAIDMALDVLKQLPEHGLTADQLASAKMSLKGMYPPEHLQTADQIATTLGEMEIFELGRDEVDQFFQRVDAVTLEQANNVASRYYRSANLTFVLLGNAAKIRGVAAKYSASVVERSVKQAGWAPM